MRHILCLSVVLTVKHPNFKIEFKLPNILCLQPPKTKNANKLEFKLFQIFIPIIIILLLWVNGRF